MQDVFLELIRRAATRLPADVIAALLEARQAEEQGSTAAGVFDAILENCRLAEASSRPLCQDTGTNLWYVHYPVGVTQAEIKKAILAATRLATKKSFLRPNAVDPITGTNSGDNTGQGAPSIHLEEWSRREIAADLLLKGGGSENVSAVYSLPDGSIKAGRDLEGVRRAVIDAVWKAQGRGCGPGIIGVGIGGDRATCMQEAKEQLFRSLGDRNANPLLAALEEQLHKECNELGIGPMGFGGRRTVLGVKIGWQHRLPASYFVAVAYLCWAARRASVVIGSKGPRFGEVSTFARKAAAKPQTKTPARRKSR